MKALKVTMAKMKTKRHELKVERDEMVDLNYDLGKNLPNKDMELAQSSSRIKQLNLELQILKEGKQGLVDRVETTQVSANTLQEDVTL
ncbi:hypothetical protein DEO72_LG3g1196 [Vigna unguiculata]|uniref:Uncharacterized protein n=1 Tax=Vigna unguiculata TaxID=3917 RepID=A0A4D6LDJ4_VIGUN|nr:hypothetical protein DEO72_LG3g1196 [Vigna unguiculata]